MQSVRKFIAGGHRIGVRCVSTADSASLRKSVVSLLDSLSLKPGATLVQNCGDSDIGKVVVQVAKERNLQTVSIFEDKPGSPDIIEELKALGGDIVVPESYTKTWYMKRLAGELRPSAGLNFSDGSQATAVCKAVTSGGTFLTYGKKLPKYVAYDGAAHKPVEWDAFLKQKNLKVLNF
ncbi:enoyl-[acyl-carrier-protein] reductase 1, mitochondrial-like [Corylus avellana]|uniref:enoyl-[acyl-carrier-protein] reductase 1, mitochondrial-like n=1 Tax=Corylus avellana TaxID=13451 RepID=UPI001E1F5C76|nr:enoyl-[acyl-carrier-protein] reductase 1, mitochondrial-like [Corylus avellana]XP_059442935.1 enoyl-[acyl-carrier-protein] reductase 1, mitochondrial-like [Corylus avellana]XP_059442936.1 enoyl-[acyl-carrier-protein] reductase 1, mitochondrial-like [Corylus avellana]